MENFALADLPGAIYKRKWVIIIITALSIVVSAIYSTYGIRPQYQVRSTVSITPIILESGIPSDSIVLTSESSKTLNTINAMDNKILGSIINQVNYPTYDANTVANLINSEEYRQKVLKAYNFQGSIQVAADAQQNQISIVVINDRPDQLVDVSKSLIEGLPEEIKKDLSVQFKVVEDFVAQGLSKEKNNMSINNKKLKEFYTSIGGLDKLEQAPVEKQSEYQDLANNYVLASQAFNAYKMVEKEIEVFKARYTSDFVNLRVVFQDSGPLKASPKMMTSILIAALLGFMLSIFIVYSMEYMKRLK